MNEIRQSFSWWCFANRGVEARELLSAAGKAGYSGVEMLPKNFWPMAKDLGLALTTITGHGSVVDGCNRRENAGRIESELLASIDCAVEWKIPMLICFSGNRNGTSDSAGLEACAEILGKVAPRAEEAGVTLSMELLNSKLDHPDYQCDQTLWGVELCRRVNSPAVKLLYDIYHMQIMEGDVIRTITTQHSFIGHYHTAGCPGRGPMDEAQELFYPAIYRAIAQSGYAGWIGHEFIPREAPVKELQRAFRQFEEALCV